MQNISFVDWSKATQAENTFVLNYGQSDRSVYRTPNNVVLIHQVTLPYNFLQPQREWTVVDMVLCASEENKAILSKMGGELNEDWGYTEDGYGMPFFEGENCLEKAYNFALSEIIQ